MVQVKILKGLKTGTEAEREAYEQLRQELRKAHPDHLPVFLEGLKRAAGKVKSPYGAPATPAAADGDAADAKDGKDAPAESAGEMTQEEACKAVLAAADEVRLYAHADCPANGLLKIATAVESLSISCICMLVRVGTYLEDMTGQSYGSGAEGAPCRSFAYRASSGCRNSSRIHLSFVPMPAA